MKKRINCLVSPNKGVKLNNFSIKQTGWWVAKAALGFFIFSVAWVVTYRFVAPPVTFLMIARYFQDTGIDKEWTDYKAISPNMVLAVVASEDQNFFEHNGFDFEAIEKAIENNKKRNIRRKRVKGASTISQQTAKNVFLWPARNWIRKGFEAYFTVLIEVFWSKERILEVYLNVAEMGKGVYGAEAASKKYFKKPAMQLNRGEAALIAAALPNPRKFSPVAPSVYLLRRQRWIVGQMENLGTEMLKGE